MVSGLNMGLRVLGPSVSRGRGMAYEKGLHPGAVWRKCDFQCHTPRDPRWSGGDPLPSGSRELEAARCAWATSFISAAAGKGLGIVAVTDHHDACFVRYVRQAAREGGVTLFPGIEITCSDNVQCLAIFDPSCEETTLTKLIHRLNDVMPAAAEEPKAHPVTVANMTIQQLADVIAGDAHLRESCLLLPHFSTEGAHKILNQHGHHKRFAELESDGVYTECDFSDIDPVTLQKIQGKISDWGARRRAVLVTGDNRSATWERLGAYNCWIKLGEDTLEAVRQAFLADEARISYSTPDVPAERIVKLRCAVDPYGESAPPDSLQ